MAQGNDQDFVPGMEAAREEETGPGGLCEAAAPVAYLQFPFYVRETFVHSFFSLPGKLSRYTNIAGNIKAYNVMKKYTNNIYMHMYEYIYMN